MTKPIIRRKYEGIEEDLIYRSSDFGTYFPLSDSISIYDREKDNVVYRKGYYCDFERNLASVAVTAELPEISVRTVSREEINRIKKAISESGVLQIRSFENSDFDVMDGEINVFYFQIDGKKKLIECDNFYMLYDGFPLDTQAGKLISLVNTLDEDFCPERNDDSDNL